MKKIILCGLILLCLTLLLPHEASAAETSGTCGENLTWEYDAATATLRISGTGPMDDWPGNTVPPWNELIVWYNDVIRHIEIGEGVTTIGTEAFPVCSVETVTLPSTLLHIGAGAFDSCHSLTQIGLPAGLLSIGSHAFYHSGLKKIDLPSGLQTIGMDAFAWTEVTKIVIPESVTEIGFAFAERCTYLSIIEFAGNAPSLQEYAFSGFSGAIIYPAGNATWTENVRQQYGGTVVWYSSDAVAAEGSWERGGYTWRLENRTLYISGDGYMHGWTVHEDPPWYMLRGAIERVVLSGNVESITSDAFAYCSNLKEIVWSETMICIFAHAFSGCVNLKEIKLPDTVSYLDQGAFSNCNQLEKVTLSKGLRTIHSSVFYNCTSLQELRFTGGIPDIYKKIETGSTTLMVYYPRSHRDWDDESVSALKLLFQDDAVFVGEGERPAMPVPTPTEPKPTEPQPPVTTERVETVPPTTVPPETTVPSEPTVPGETTGPETKPSEAPTTKPDATDAPSTAPTQPGGQQDDDPRSLVTALIVSGGLILLGGAAAVWFFLLRKRK